ncbi:MAG TPA: transcriptional regulator BetI [Thermoleophilia bacterium]|nr:transcriptional regulator BetI [Thermoleophilia bacterium]
MANAVSTKSPREINAEQRRSDLIEATIRCIAEFGIAGASVEKITEAAGVSRGLIRHYFGSKNQLLVQASQRLWDEFAAVLRGRHSPDNDPESELRWIIRQTFSEPMFSPERLHAWFGFWHAARSNPELERINEEGYSMERFRYRELLGRAAARRRREIDADLAGDGLAAVADGVWLQLLVDPAGCTTAHAEGVCNHYVDLVLGGPPRGGERG